MKINRRQAGETYVGTQGNAVNYGNIISSWKTIDRWM